MNSSESKPGAQPPALITRVPGESSRSFHVRHAHASAPMGPPPGPPGIVYASAEGSNVTCVDRNRFVDLAGGFGAALLGHRHPSVLRALEIQQQRLLHALGDVHPSDAKVGLIERLSRLHPLASAQVILGQSGSDAVSAALKTACLATGRPGVLAFAGAYHGLGYGPLAAGALRASYREPFAAQLNPHVRFLAYPDSDAAMPAVLEAAERALADHEIGAVLVEPILGRGGVIVPPAAFLRELSQRALAHGALLIADEIWTGLGRAGSMLRSVAEGVTPDLVCLGKGLGGGLPLSAVIGRREVMAAWRRKDEVVHTSTFAGAPLACATALATLDVLGREALPARATRVGAWLQEQLTLALRFAPEVSVRGAGLMIGVDLGKRPGAAIGVVRGLLERGYIATTGGGQREALVLTPPLSIDEGLLPAAVAAVAEAVAAAVAS
jgi:4-aminobutyrate aminotransferase / (S)-3-amino-2-methylpropionate transaminase / 5-aminovalerate transaminase